MTRPVTRPLIPPASPSTAAVAAPGTSPATAPSKGQSTAAVAAVKIAPAARPAGPARMLVVAPGTAGADLAETADITRPAARTFFETLAGEPGLSAHLLTALPATTPGLHLPPGAVFAAARDAAGTPENAPESASMAAATVMAVPNLDEALLLNRSWYLAERLREFLAAGRFDLVCIFLGAPVGLDIVTLAATALPAARLALILTDPAPLADPDGGSGPVPSRGAPAGLVLAEMARNADMVLCLPGAGIPPGLDPALCRQEADARACLSLISGALAPNRGR